MYIIILKNQTRTNKGDHEIAKNILANFHLYQYFLSIKSIYYIITDK